MVVKREEIEGVVAVVVGVIVVVIDGIVVSDTAVVDPILSYHVLKMLQSSILTNAVPIGQVHDHPVLHFARDGANFSLNSDDPTVIGTRLAAEYETVRSWGLTEAHLVRAVSTG